LLWTDQNLFVFYEVATAAGVFLNDEIFEIFTNSQMLMLPMWKLYMHRHATLNSRL